MPPDIAPQFNYYGRAAHQFYENELVELLCPRPLPKDPAQVTPLSLNASASLKNDKTGSSYDFKLEKTADGKKITLDATLVRDGQTYKTNFTAVQVRDDLYQIQNLTFDNHVERLDSRWEITKVLGHIGREGLLKGASNIIPAAHEENGKFGKFRRFLTRCMPDNPHTMMPPPC